MKSHIKKRTIIITVTVLVIMAVCAGLFFVVQKYMRKSVNVYSVADLMMEDVSEMSTLSGVVTNSSLHGYSLKSGTLVSKVYVKAGDKVKKGDKLFKYDMSMTELQLDKNNLSKQNLQLANEDLQDEIKNLKAGKNADGSEKEDDVIEEGVTEELELESQDDSSEEEDEGSGESIREKEKQIRDNKLEIRQLDITITKLKEELKENVVKSTVDGVVKTAGSKESANADVTIDYSSLDTGDEEEGEEDNVDSSEPADDLGTSENTAGSFIEITTSTGSFIETAIDEYSLKNIKIGDELTGTSYNTGEEFTATITEISQFPSEDENASAMYDMGDSSGNVTYYPVTAKVAEGVELADQEYVDLQMPSTDVSHSAFYIETAFVKNEDGNQYVYVLDEDGKLKKEKVNVVRMSSDGMSQIDSELTEDDYIAFPYGKNVQEGATTKKADIESLYE